MKNLFLEHKIKKELKRFQEFKNKFEFEMKEIQEKQDGSIFCGDICLKSSDGEWNNETKDIINVAYMFHGHYQKTLSNLFNYNFYFKGFKLASAEAVFQSLKISDKNVQKLVFGYSGPAANKISTAADYDWKENGIVYFQGKPMVRDSKDYDDFIDEMYVSMLQNPLFRNTLKNVGDKYIMHSIGGSDKAKTLYTRYEFELEFNCLKAYVQKYYNK